MCVDKNWIKSENLKSENLLKGLAMTGRPALRLSLSLKKHQGTIWPSGLSIHQTIYMVTAIVVNLWSMDLCSDWQDHRNIGLRLGDLWLRQARPKLGLQRYWSIHSPCKKFSLWTVYCSELQKHSAMFYLNVQFLMYLLKILLQTYERSLQSQTPQSEHFRRFDCKQW